MQPAASSVRSADEVGADRGDAAVDDHHVGRALPGGVDDATALDDEGSGPQARAGSSSVRVGGGSGSAAAGGDQVGAGAEQQVQDGHAHGDAVADLVEDQRAGQVGHLGGDLDPAVHGPGVHDQGVVARAARPAGW